MCHDVHMFVGASGILLLHCLRHAEMVLSWVANASTTYTSRSTAAIHHDWNCHDRHLVKLL